MMKTIKATVQKGHGVASGQSETDRRFPQGTIRMQEPFFKEKGLDLQAYFDGDFVYGTLNLSVEPQRVMPAEPEIYIEDVKWTGEFDPENFYLSPAEIVYKLTPYKALLYIPDPKTKPDHFQPPSTVEAIAQKIEGIKPGDTVTLIYSEDALTFFLKGDQRSL
ncbi:MAG: hypothetical protein PHS57_04845 [Alphaproteobacteria bacterium]|nr:hypothetical protein [Alphaproteobacteria bacterium]